MLSVLRVQQEAYHSYCCVKTDGKRRTRHGALLYVFLYFNGELCSESVMFAVDSLLGGGEPIVSLV